VLFHSRQLQDAHRRGPTLGLIALGVTLLALAATTPAAASPAARTPTVEEQKLFAEGVRLYQAGDGRGAEKAFKAGFALGHDPAFLVRLGEAQELAGAPREAADTYARYLRETPDASDRADIEARVARLTPAAVPAAPAPSAEVPGELAAPGQPAPGAPEVVVAAPPPPVATAPVAAPPPISQQAKDDEELRALVDENAPRRSRLNVAAWVGAGVTVALLGTAAFFAAKASEKESDVNYLLGNFDGKTGVPIEYALVASRYEADVRDGRRDNRLAKGFALGAGVAALARTALFIVDALRGTHDDGGTSHARLVPLAPVANAQAAHGMALGWSF
jgi:hypothetical protein